jgi:hypothetical protein
LGSAVCFFEGVEVAMFYVKEPITDNMEFQMEITDKNVFCRCPVCGKEVSGESGRKSWEKAKGTCLAQLFCARNVPEN